MCSLKVAHFCTFGIQVCLLPARDHENQDTGFSHIKMRKTNFPPQKTELIEVENYLDSLLIKA